MTADVARVVYIVDDDAAVRDSLSMLLRSAGLGVETAWILDAHPEIVREGASQVYVARDQERLGIILYKYPARP